MEDTRRIAAYGYVLRVHLTGNAAARMREQHAQQASQQATSIAGNLARAPPFKPSALVWGSETVWLWLLALNPFASLSGPVSSTGQSENFTLGCNVR